MRLSEEIKGSLGTFSPNPDEWKLEQRLGLRWGKRAWELEEAILEAFKEYPYEAESGIKKITLQSFAKIKRLVLGI